MFEKMDCFVAAHFAVAKYAKLLAMTDLFCGRSFLE
jgi:hypothetical protein